MKNTRAIILAAGYGNRMRPLTDAKHKTLLTISGKTIISRIIDGLIENQITDIVIATGYRAKELSEYLAKTYPDIDFLYVHNEKYKTTNNIYTLSLVLNTIDIAKDILLIESDLIYEPKIIKKIIDSPYDNVALLDKFRSGMDGTVVTVSDDRITSIIPPHLQSVNFDFSDKYKTLNIYKFSKAFASTTFKQLLTYYASVIDDNCYYELILGILIYMQRQTIYAEIVTGEKWAEVDDVNDLAIADFIFTKESREKHLAGVCGGYWNYDITDFCFIRNMYFPNASMISEARSNLEKLMFNYGSKQTELNKKLAYFLLRDMNNVVLLNGASQIYPFLREKFRGVRALTPSPSFGEYPRIFPDAVAYSDAVGISMEEIEAKIDGVSIVVFVNPNNPTGTTVETEKIRALAEKRPDKFFVVDESFIDFSGRPSIADSLETVPLGNVLVIKSLSKVLGVPGLRLGYAYSTDRALIAELMGALPIWNSNSLAEFFLEIILKHRNSLRQSIEKTIADREDFRKGLEALPCVETVYPSGANYLLIKASGDRDRYAGFVDRVLRETGFYLKDVSSKMAGKGFFLRLAVRLPRENERLLEILSKYAGTTPDNNVD